MTLGDVLQQAAYTLPLWRDIVIASLACVVIGALWLYASLMGIE